MKKVFDAYAKRKSVAPTALRFLLDGERIVGDQTPEKVSVPLGLCDELEKMNADFIDFSK